MTRIGTLLNLILALALLSCHPTPTISKDAPQSQKIEADIKSSGTITLPSTKSRRKASLPILDNLFPGQSLDDAWESHPLLISNLLTDNTTNNQKKIPHRPPLKTNPHRFRKLIELISLDEILSPYNDDLQHGTDYIIGKKVIRNDQEWLGMLPGSPTVEDAKMAFFKGGFSLIVTKMQQRWGPVARMARLIEAEIQSWAVSCNLYATPGVMERKGKRLSGFETHFDWMDVIVIQVSGEKVWRVGRTPLVYLPTQDMKRKPTVGEISAHAEHGGYDEFVLRPGDVLYIPRGFLHNASTVYSSFDNGGGPDPSLHLTFGIEHNCETTMEGLLHQAFDLFVQSSGALANRRMEQIAIHDYPCGENNSQEISWSTFIHFTISEVARRENECNATTNGTTTEWKLCHLRKSLPLVPALREVVYEKTNTYPDGNNEDFGNDLENEFLEALDITTHKMPDASKTISFLSQILSSEEDLAKKLCFPNMSTIDSLLVRSCVPLNSVLPLVPEETTFRQILEDFHVFGATIFRKALKQLEKHQLDHRLKRWRKADHDLDKMGHSAFSGRVG